MNGKIVKIVINDKENAELIEGIGALDREGDIVPNKLFQALMKPRAGHIMEVLLLSHIISWHCPRVKFFGVNEIHEQKFTYKKLKLVVQTLGDIYGVHRTTITTALQALIKGGYIKRFKVKEEPKVWYVAPILEKIAPILGQKMSAIPTSDVSLTNNGTSVEPTSTSVKLTSHVSSTDTARQSNRRGMSAKPTSDVSLTDRSQIPPRNFPSSSQELASRGDDEGTRFVSPPATEGAEPPGPPMHDLRSWWTYYMGIVTGREEHLSEDAVRAIGVWCANNDGWEWWTVVLVCFAAFNEIALNREGFRLRPECHLLNPTGINKPVAGKEGNFALEIFREDLRIPTGLTQEDVYDGLCSSLEERERLLNKPVSIQAKAADDVTRHEVLDLADFGIVWNYTSVERLAFPDAAREEAASFIRNFSGNDESPMNSKWIQVAMICAAVNSYLTPEQDAVERGPNNPTKPWQYGGVACLRPEILFMFDDHGNRYVGEMLKETGLLVPRPTDEELDAKLLEMRQIIEQNQLRPQMEELRKWQDVQPTSARTSLQLEQAYNR